MKKVFLMTLALFVMLASGCRHTDGGGRRGGRDGWIPQPAIPPVRNTLRSATFKATLNKAVNHKHYALDLTKVPSMYQEEIKFYLMNALSHQDMEYLPKSRFLIQVSLMDSNIGLDNIRGIRERNLDLVLTGFEKKELCWNVEVKARGRANVSANGWLPGMMAVATYYMGQNRGGMQQIGTIPTAVFQVNNPKR